MKSMSRSAKLIRILLILSCLCLLLLLLDYNDEIEPMLQIPYNIKTPTQDSIPLIIHQSWKNKFLPPVKYFYLKLEIQIMAKDMDQKSSKLDF